MTHLDARERAELSDLLVELGPSAPTLCGDWTTEELAAHLVIRERNPLSGPGILLGGPFERVTDWAQEREMRRGHAAVVERVRTGPPLVPWRIPGLREPLNLNEYFVHHEDVRRANGRGPRTDRPDLDDALAGVVGRMAGLQLRRGRVEVALVTEDGTVLAGRGENPPRVVGRAGELLLWLNGRVAVADVAYEGSDVQIAALRATDLGI